MPRHSFIQMSKLTNLKGRIDYISSHARQENLYAVYKTAERKFWRELAQCNQEEFKKSGTAGKCIEAREFIIALQMCIRDRSMDLMNLEEVIQILETQENMLTILEEQQTEIEQLEMMNLHLKESLEETTQLEKALNKENQILRLQNRKLVEQNQILKIQIESLRNLKG